MTITTAPPTAPAPEVDRRSGTSVARWVRDRGCYVALVLLLFYNAFFTTDFLAVANLRLILLQVVPILIVSLGMALVIGTRGIDLSVGSTMAIAGALMARSINPAGNPVTQTLVAIGLAVLAGLAIGVFNGVVISYAGVQPIVATLGLLVAGRGLALVIAGGALVEIFDDFVLNLSKGQLFGVNYSLIITLVLVGLTAVLVRNTTFGRQLVAIGGNPAASRLAGLPVRRTLITVYALSGVLAAVAGVMASSRLRASDPSFVGLLIELSAITAVVIGGTPLSGGRVRILGTVAGALLMQVLTTTLVSHNISDSVARMIQAAIILAAVYLQRETRTSS